ncbi:hypothetical protein [Massilia sp. Root335]|uniref:hypothetical protein n=1 Tax=Massilia sp. Root335 TaxID=1736517 RepID=UPI000AC91118|nr:hypothetical protein [Massilia sp. Root335]
MRDAARVIGVHRTTSFRWRHRFVPGAMRDRPAMLAAIVEADETYRLESQKGSLNQTRTPRKRGGVATRRAIDHEHDCLFVARDRTPIHRPTTGYASCALGCASMDGAGNRTPMTYKMILPLVDLSGITIPPAETIVAIGNLGAIPGAMPCE